jgi:hypothetical protein
LSMKIRIVQVRTGGLGRLKILEVQKVLVHLLHFQESLSPIRDGLVPC